LADLAAPGVVAATHVPPLHFRSIQTGRVAFVRWFGFHVCASTGSLHVLLAALLLVFDPRCSMSGQFNNSGSTPDDLVSEAGVRHSPVALNYQIVAQSLEDVRNIQNAPAVSMGPYLLASGQIRLLTTISVYSLRGESREQIRLLYMNATAIRIWKEMGNAPNVIGQQMRPPHQALLTFGVPFSE
jgi:hypothetical protein